MIQIWPNLSCTSTSAGSVLAWQYWAILLIVACTCGLVKSKVSEKQNQRDTLRSLGLKRIGDSVVRPDDAQTRGYVKTVAHLVKVEEID